MGLGHKFKEVKKAYTEANKLLGDLIKVRHQIQDHVSHWLQECTLLLEVNSEYTAVRSEYFHTSPGPAVDLGSNFSS